MQTDEMAFWRDKDKHWLFRQTTGSSGDCLFSSGTHPKIPSIAYRPIHLLFLYKTQTHSLIMFNLLSLGVLALSIFYNVSSQYSHMKYNLCPRKILYLSFEKRVKAQTNSLITFKLLGLGNNFEIFWAFFFFF